MVKKVKLFLFMILSLAFASSAQAGYMGLSPQAGGALIALVLFVGAVMLIVSLIIHLVKWLKAKIKEWASNWED